MLEELKESASTTIKERISSPFYGAVIISWLLWNWQIPYITFFVSQDKLDLPKHRYIIENCSKWHINYLLPLISAAFISLVMPFVLGWIDDIIDYAKKLRAKRLYKKQNQVILTNGDYNKFKCKIYVDALVKSIEMSYFFNINTEKSLTRVKLDKKQLAEEIDNKYQNVTMYKDLIFFHLNNIDQYNNVFIQILDGLGYLNLNRSLTTKGVNKLLEYKDEVGDVYSEYIKLYYANKLSDV